MAATEKEPRTQPRTTRQRHDEVTGVAGHRQRLHTATEGYAASMANLTRTPLAQDMVFADGYSLQMARVAGTVAAGLTATLVVPV